MRVPKNSTINLWLNGLEGLETPTTYLILVCLSSLGSLLGRQVWVDQDRWKVYPNLSVFLVGPSGLGKDTAIDEGVKLIERCGGTIVSSRTTEHICEILVGLGDPAVATIVATEAADFFGRKEYQSGKIEFITNILSTKDKYDFSSRSEGKLLIRRPTITCMFGSTPAWLQKNMPTGTLEGGFFPRFVVVNESKARQCVPWVKYSAGKSEQDSRASSMEAFYTWVAKVLNKYTKYPREFPPTTAAQAAYANWYHNRFNYFSPSIAEYANRSRDQVLRLAMLSAITCSRNYIDVEDISFSVSLMQYVCRSIESIIKPGSSERSCQEDYLLCLPATRADVMRRLRKSYDIRDILNAEKMLLHSNLIREVPGTHMLERRR